VFLKDDAEFPNLACMPYSNAALITLARFFSEFPNPQPRTRLTLRWWVWRGALSKRLATSSDGLINALFRAVDVANESQAALNLLRDAGHVPSFPTGELPWNSRSADVRACMTAILARRGVTGDEDLEEEEDDGQLPPDKEGHASLLFRTLDRKRPSSVAEAFALGDTTIAPVFEPDEELLDRHLLPREAFEAFFRQGDHETFLRLRRQVLDRWLVQYFAERCGLGEPERPAIGTIAKTVESSFASVRS